jgi:hypothetical protein
MSDEETKGRPAAERPRGLSWLLRERSSSPFSERDGALRSVDWRHILWSNSKAWYPTGTSAMGGASHAKTRRERRFIAIPVGSALG